MKVAAAIFVRTPGLSLPKSRLAQEIGVEQANKAYELSLECSKVLARNMVAEGLEVVWAVAEPEGIHADYWKETGLEAVLSGEGGLGSCLANMHTLLCQRADMAILLGSDSPQLGLEDMKPAWQKEGTASMFAIPSTDGGFFMFSSSEQIKTQVWEQVEYSTSTTLIQLEQAIGRPIKRLETHPDFDDLASLWEVLEDMPENLNPAQQEFLNYGSGLFLDVEKNYVSRSRSAKNIS